MSGAAYQVKAKIAPPVTSRLTTPNRLRISSSMQKSSPITMRDQHRHVAGGGQPRSAEPEQGRRDVSGGGGQDHPGAGGPAPGQRDTRGVGVQPDALQLAPGEQRHQRVPALVGDRDQAPGELPGGGP